MQAINACGIDESRDSMPGVRNVISVQCRERWGNDQRIWSPLDQKALRPERLIGLQSFVGKTKILCVRIERLAIVCEDNSIRLACSVGVCVYQHWRTLELARRIERMCRWSTVREALRGLSSGDWELILFCLLWVAL